MAPRRMRDQLLHVVVLLAAGCAHGPRPLPAPEGWSAYLAADGARASASLSAGSDLLARFGYASLIHDRAHYAEAREVWVDVVRRAAVSTSPLAPSIAAFAAHRLDVSAQELGGPSEAWARELERVAGLPVGPEARWILAGSAAVEWARLGQSEGVRRVARARGCPSRVRVAPPGDGAPPEALQAPWGAPPRGAAVDVATCLVPLQDPLGRGGSYSLSVDIESDRARAAVLWIDSDGAFAAPGYVHDSIDRFVSRRVGLQIHVPSGRSRVDLRVTSGGRGGVWLALLAREGAQQGLQFGATVDAPAIRARVLGPVAPGAPPPVAGGAEPVGLFLDAHERYRQSDADGARRALDRLALIAPRFAPGLALSAAVDLVDPALPSAIGRDRARASLARAVALDSTMARAAQNLALIERQDERFDEAMSWIEAGRRAAPKTFRFDLLEAEMQLERGWTREARDALQRAAALAPDACDVARFALELAQRVGDAAGEEAGARALSRCDATTDALADWLRRQGRLDEAAKEYARLLELRPWHVAWRLTLADVRAGQGDRTAARSLLEALLLEDPLADESRRRLADLSLAAGDETGAREVVGRGLRVDPGSAVAARLGHALGTLDPILAFRVDGREVVRAFASDPWKPGREAAAVVVLDRTVLLVARDGSTRSLTHNVMRVLAKEGIERFGEVDVPEGAEILTVRTLKPDGRALEAQEIAGKESLSAPDLQVGDYVEFEWVERTASSPRYRGGFLADRFYFRSYDAPLYRTEYVVASPDDMELQIDARGGAPAPARANGGGDDVRTFAMARMDQLGSEPRAAPFLDDVPSIRVGARVSWEAWQQDMREVVRRNGRISETAAAMARRLCRSPDTNCVDALLRQVAEIDETGATLGPASAAFAERSGSRVMLLRSMLRAAGLLPELWLVRPRSADVADGVLPETREFSVALLRVPVGDTVLWLDPRLRFARAGQIAPLLSGATAYRVEPAQAVLGQGRVGASRGNDRRVMDLEITLRPDGSAVVSGAEELRGLLAALWREGLAQLPADKVREEIEQRWLGFHFPGLDLADLDVAPLASVGTSLAMRYRFAAPHIARPQGRDLRVRLGLFPALLGREYVGVSQRRSPLQVDERIDTVLRLRLSVPTGKRVATLPRDAELDTPFGRYRRRVRLDGATLLFERELIVQPQRVAPARYADFMRFVSAVDAFDEETAVLR